MRSMILYIKEIIGAVMDALIDVSRRQDINNYLEKMLEDEHNKIAVKANKRRQKSRSKLELKGPKNTRRFILEETLD